MPKSFRTILFLAAMFALNACQLDNKQEKNYVFEKNTWHRFNILSFDFLVRDIKSTYKISAAIQVSSDFEHSSIPVHVIMTSPGGEERIWEQNFPIFKDDGKPAGKVKGNFIELEIPMRIKHKFSESGNYLITIEQVIPKYDTPGVVSFGIRIEKE